ncbi:MAG: GTPase [Candidatus Anstonellales archaeon]
MSGIEEKIRKIEEEMARTQKNKATEHHLGRLKAKIAQLKAEAEHKKSIGKSSYGYGLKKEGDATVVLLGFPNAGKSSILSKLTNAKSEIANYEFTTLRVIPGMMVHKGFRIQILDIPGIITGASKGKGRGKEVLSIARSADLILIVVPADRPEQYQLIVEEMEKAGVVLNKERPYVRIERTATGGVKVLGSTGKMSYNEITGILSAFSIFNANVVVGRDVDSDAFIEAILPRTVYKKAIVVENKVDIAKPSLSFALPISCATGYNIEKLKDFIVDNLGFIRVYTNPKGGKPDQEPIILPKGATVADLCAKIYRCMEAESRGAIVNGKSASFPNQMVGLDHMLADGDVVRIVKHADKKRNR